MAQIFPRWTNEIPRIGTPAAIVAGGAAVFVVWFWFSPSHTDVGYAPEQPIAYSHKLHAGDLGIDCRYCHIAERSQHSGVPSTQVCMNCHKQVLADSPKLEALRKSWGDGKPENDGGPIAWKRIHKSPDYVYFPHSAHVNIAHEGAAVGCVTCHGRVDEMLTVRQTQPLSMSWCMDCHSNPAPNLRPIGEVTNMTWQADLEWKKQAHEIAQRLLPPGTTNAQAVLPDGTHVTKATAGCTGCHR